VKAKEILAARFVFFGGLLVGSGSRVFAPPPTGSRSPFTARRGRSSAPSGSRQTAGSSSWRS